MNCSRGKYRVYSAIVLSWLFLQVESMAEQVRKKTTSTGIVAIQSGRLNIRRGPGADYPVIATAAKGDVLSIVEEPEEWCKIRLSDGEVGYACGIYIRIQKPGVPEISFTAQWDVAWWENHFQMHGISYGAWREKWMALVQNSHDCALKYMEIQVFKWIDEYEIGGVQKMFALQKSKTTPIVLIRGIENVRPGKIETAINKPRKLKVNAPIQFRLRNGRAYELNIVCKKSASQGHARLDGSLILSSKSKSQKITVFDVYWPEGEKPVLGSEAGASIMWAGDIDKDGKIDLLLNLSKHYNMNAPTLFLSSPVQNDDLVKKVAAYFQLGC